MWDWFYLRFTRHTAVFQSLIENLLSNLESWDEDLLCAITLTNPFIYFNLLKAMDTEVFLSSNKNLQLLFVSCVLCLVSFWQL